MMKIYARVFNGFLVEIIQPLTYEAESPNWSDGDPSRIGLEIPIEERYTPEFVLSLVDITDLDPIPVEGWTYDGSIFTPVVIPPIDYSVINAATRSALNTQASQAMIPYFLATNLGNATDDETLKAKAWQAYYRDLQLVDLTVADPAWPDIP